jgi:hypothetical protein
MNTFTLVHVVISLIGIVSGIVVLLGFLSAKRLDGWNAIFLITTVLTSVTGFLFPFHKLLPSHILALCPWSYWHSPCSRATCVAWLARGAGLTQSPPPSRCTLTSLS